MRYDAIRHGHIFFTRKEKIIISMSWKIDNLKEEKTIEDENQAEISPERNAEKIYNRIKYNKKN